MINRRNHDNNATLNQGQEVPCGINRCAIPTSVSSRHELQGIHGGGAFSTRRSASAEKPALTFDLEETILKLVLPGPTFP
jgi:hypothetical protein